MEKLFSEGLFDWQAKVESDEKNNYISKYTECQIFIERKCEKIKNSCTTLMHFKLSLAPYNGKQSKLIISLVQKVSSV